MIESLGVWETFVYRQLFDSNLCPCLISVHYASSGHLAHLTAGGRLSSILDSFGPFLQLS